MTAAVRPGENGDFDGPPERSRGATSESAPPRRSMLHREAAALADYSQRREALLREVFDLTNELVAFPAPARFLALQKQLGQAIDHQAAQLAALTPSAVG